MGTSPAVFIFPEDIELASGPTSFHRQFLDLYISQYNHRYLDDLIAYRKVILQRNKLLKDIAHDENNLQQLKVWDDLLIEHGLRIVVERDRFIKSINGHVGRYYGKFDSDSELTLSYRPKIDLSEPDMRKAIEKHLATYQPRELRAGLTLVGPHRDRLEINLNTKSVRHYGSRGQKRCIMIAMKLAAADFLSHIKDEPVMLVLDEVFAELDNTKAGALMGTLSGYGQVFMATAGEFGFTGNQFTRFDVNNGKINRISDDSGN